MLPLPRQIYKSVGDIARHCNLDKLAIAENEALTFDLPEIFCENWFSISEILNRHLDVEGTNTPEEEKLLLGSSYIGCSGRNFQQAGILAAIAYYSYARYITINGYNDTAVGLKQKNDNFTMPVPLAELQNYSDKYRNMGKVTANRIKSFLCRSKVEFPFYIGNCVCECGSENCGSGIATKGFGFSSKNISKYDL